MSGVPHPVLSRAKKITEFEDRGEPIRARQAGRLEGQALTLASAKVRRNMYVAQVRCYPPPLSGASLGYALPALGAQFVLCSLRRHVLRQMCKPRLDDLERLPCL